MSLALATLLYEWRRYMAAVVALAFSGLLVLAFLGMFMGIGKAFTAQIDRDVEQALGQPRQAVEPFIGRGVEQAERVQDADTLGFVGWHLRC